MFLAHADLMQVSKHRTMTALVGFCCEAKVVPRCLKFMACLVQRFHCTFNSETEKTRTFGMVIKKDEGS